MSIHFIWKPVCLSVHKVQAMEGGGSCTDPTLQLKTKKRLEKFSFWCKYSRAEAIGTVVCLGAAMALTFLMSPTSSSPHPTTINFEWILGFFYLLVASIIISGGAVLQAATMLRFPAPLSLCLTTTLMGSIMTAIVELVMEGNLDIGPPSFDFKNTTFVILVAGVSSLGMAFMTWCVNKKGPLMVSIFNPSSDHLFCNTICRAPETYVLSRVSIVGMLLMFVGLYVVLWAKKKED